MPTSTPPRRPAVVVAASVASHVLLLALLVLGSRSGFKLAEHAYCVLVTFIGSMCLLCATQWSAAVDRLEDSSDDKLWRIRKGPIPAYVRWPVYVAHAWLLVSAGWYITSAFFASFVVYLEGIRLVARDELALRDWLRFNQASGERS